MVQGINAIIKCPKCKKSGVISIPRERFNRFSEGGLLKLAFDHGDHVFVVWIDSYGYQRASDVFNTLEESTTLRERVSLDDLINLFGEEVFSKILTASICGFRTYIDFESNYLRFLDYLITFLLREYPNVVENPNLAEVTISLSNDISKIPGEEYFYKVLKEIKKISDNKIKLLKLKLAIETIRKLSERIKREIIKYKKPVSLIEISKMVKITDRNMLILAVNRAIYRNPELKKFIKEKAHIFSS